MTDITECGRVPVAVAARILKLDSQTVRLIWLRFGECSASFIQIIIL